MPFSPNRLILAFIILLTPSFLLAAEVGGTIDETIIWTAASSPYHVVDDILISGDAHLTIQPGVIVQFDPETGITVNGLLTAEGTTNDSIRFTCTGDPEPGAWGGLRFQGGSEDCPWDIDGKPNGAGSLLKYCIIEYAGGGEFMFSSPVSVAFSCVYISHSTIKNGIGDKGAVNCGNISKALIENCLITGNHTSRGGAVSLGVGSKSIIRNNIFSLNTADDNGGAVYLTMAETELTDNSFLRNRAGGLGGAIYAATSSRLIITGNSFLENSSDYAAPTICLTNDIESEISGNIFGVNHHAVYLEGAKSDANAVGNYWGRPDVLDFRYVFKDRTNDFDEPFVNYRPPLWAPPVTMPTNPSAVNSIQLCRDDTFTDEIPHGVAEGAPMRIRLNADDLNPVTADIIQVRVVSAKDPQGIIIPLLETAPDNGVFTGRGEVAINSKQEAYTIGDTIGGSVKIFAPFYPDVIAEYATMTPKPLAEHYTIPDVADIQHLTGHNPRFTWTYFEVVERPQTHYRFRVFPAQGGAPVWDTGEYETGQHEVTYKGALLEDGAAYTGRLEVYSSYLWSDPVELPFRMNSLPTPPVPARPADNELTATQTPGIVVQVSADAEKDSLTYSYEIYPINNRQDIVQQVSNIVPGATEVVWALQEQLSENDGFQFRARAVDPYEQGPWGEFREFWINSTEEAADPFDLSEPQDNTTIYPLHPKLVWTEAVDPDPLSSVTYNVEIDKTETFDNPQTYTGITPLEFTVPDSLDNRTTYFWRVTAIDNTERTTGSSSVYKYYVDTTPSVPVMLAPLTGEERMPPDNLTWEACNDPDPNDIIMYDVEVFDSPELMNKVAGITSWESTALPVQNLEGWEKLIDNQIYFWQVRSRDNHNADSKYSSAGSFFFNRYNDNPEPVPGITAPADTVMGSNDILFTWLESSDIDLSDTKATLVYEVEATLTNFESNEVRRFASASGVTQLTGKLDDNRLWNYRVRVRDDEGAVSTWSEVRQVLVNVAEDAPTPFALISPTQGNVVVELDSLLFVWEASSDPDWESSIRYRLDLYPDAADHFSVELVETQYMFKGGLVNESGCRWIVTAIDNIGLETVVQSEFRFTTNTTPSAPSVAAMEDELLPEGLLAFNGAKDPNPVDRLIYTIEIAADATFAAPLVHVEGLNHHEGAMTAIIGQQAGSEALEDDVDYFFRVQAVDNHAYKGAFTEPHKFRFNRANDAPEMPGGPYAPTSSLVVRSQSPELTWTASADEDLSDPTSSLSYDLRLDRDGELEQNSTYQFATMPGSAMIKLPAPMADNMPWVWQVRSRDNEGAVSEWSPIQTMLINVKEDAPTPPATMKPYPGQTFNILGPVDFAWSASMDQDYQSSITYRVEYGTSQDFAGAMKITNLDTTTASVKGPLENTTYFWRVIAIDNTGLETASQTANFILNTRPTVPQPMSPMSKVEVLPDGSLKWMASSDPNPKDKIVYAVRIGTGPGSDGGRGGMTKEKSDVTGTTISLKDAGWDPDAVVTGFGDNIVCHWQVMATDEHGIESEWSSAVEFIFNARNDQPGQVKELLTPKEGEEVNNVTLTWRYADDPDPSDTPDKMSYRVELANDMAFSADVRTHETGMGVTVLNPVDLTDNSEWYWHVSARDDEGAMGQESSVSSFILNKFNDAPLDFSLSEPGREMALEGTVDGLSITFRWAQAEDPDPNDRLTYDLIIARDPGFTIGMKKFDGLKGTQFSPPPSTFRTEGMYYWKVAARDRAGSQVWGMKSDQQPWSFTVSIPQPEPTPAPTPTPGG